jgi:hypothetical protein
VLAKLKFYISSLAPERLKRAARVGSSMETSKYLNEGPLQAIARSPIMLPSHRDGGYGNVIGK